MHDRSDVVQAVAVRAPAPDGPGAVGRERRHLSGWNLVAPGGRRRLEAAAPTGYKALVCVFLFGGNDGNNMFIPYDDYASYQKVRGSALNVPKDSLLKVSSASQKAAFDLPDM